MLGFHKLSVEAIKKASHDAVSITFDVPEALRDTFIFRAGQYITLKATVQGTPIRRDYSLCVSPQSGLLEVAVKHLEGGIFSSYVNTQLRVGDVLEVSPPKGRFMFDARTQKAKRIVAFAAGSGITPILSIIRCALEEDPKSRVVLVYGNKTKADTMFLNELLELQRRYSTRFYIHLVFSQAKESDALFGRIRKQTVALIVKDIYPYTADDIFYLCGPEGMIGVVREALSAYGVEKQYINFELFKTIKRTSDNIQEAGIDVETHVTVIVDDVTHSFKMASKQTLLEAALDSGFDVPYSCQGGICSSCLARVKEGQVTMRQNTILTKNEVAEGLVLTCQAEPKSPTITVDYDDV